MDMMHRTQRLPGRPIWAPLTLMIIAIAAGPACTRAAAAADFPRSGEAVFDVYLSGKIVASAATPVGKGVVWQETGVTRNVKGEAPFDRLEDVCLGHATVIGDDWTRLYGTCVKTDQDGDQILVTWGDVKEQWSIVGGTGKYKGITGTGTTGKFDSLQDRPDGWTGVGHETIRWEIR